MANIIIEIGGEPFRASLTGERSPETVRKILAALPVESVAMQWGDEVYFEIPVDMGPENGVEKVTKGDLGYWPAGRCFCIFYGRTPMSRTEEEIIPASAVNLVGRVENPDGFKKHSEGEAVVIKPAE